MKTNREQFEEQFNHLGTTEKLFATSNVAYIYWLENRLTEYDGTFKFMNEANMSLVADLNETIILQNTRLTKLIDENEKLNKIIDELREQKVELQDIIKKNN